MCKDGTILGLGEEKILFAGEDGGRTVKGGTDNGDGLFLCVDGFSVFRSMMLFALLAQRADKAGSLDLIALPPNFASNEGNDVLDPKVGVPHLEMARPAISRCVFPISGGARLDTVEHASPSPLLLTMDPPSPGSISAGNAVICPK